MNAPEFCANSQYLADVSPIIPTAYITPETLAHLLTTLDFNLIINELVQKSWSVQTRFWPTWLVTGLQAEARQLHQEGLFKPAHVRHAVYTEFQRDQRIRGDQIYWLEQRLPLPFQRAYLYALEQLRQTLNQQLFLGLAGLEAHFALYPPNSFYRKHYDRVAQESERVVTVVSYLTADWSLMAGGMLRLYDPEQPKQCIAEVLPHAGTFVCFLSERIPHEVCITERERLSITGWFRRRDELGEWL